MADAAQAEKGRKLMMNGAMIAMGACMIGGLGAVAMAVLGQRTIGIGLGIAAGAAILFGIWLQVKGFGLLKKATGK